MKSVGRQLESEITAGETLICQLVKNACAHCKNEFTVCARIQSHAAVIRKNCLWRKETNHFGEIM